MAAPAHFPSLSSSLSAGGQLASHYQVFLSFRGPDVRHNFADILYNELIKAGIPRVFRDKEEIRGGEDISSTLTAAIERSDISIPIISGHYAESKACLVELAHMSRCRKKKEHKVIPIFYDVEPSTFLEALKNELSRSPTSAESFGNHNETIEEWKEVLLDLAKGKEKYHSLSSNGYWSNLISQVVSDVKEHLRMGYLPVPDDLVGVNDHVREMMRKLGVVCCDGKAAELHGEEIRVVTITGISGIGKTTLAKVIFNHIQHLFQAYSFLENIQIHQLESLQEQLIKNLNKREYPKSDYNTHVYALRTMFRETRVLIILDDIQSNEDIEGLAADCSWFGPRSRIILTTNNVNLQKTGLLHEAQIHKVEELAEPSAIQLFLKHACGTNHPQTSDELICLAKQIISFVTGVPYAIEFIGKNLCGMKKDIWEEMLSSFKKNPPKSINNSFEVVYSVLGKNPSSGKEIQQIFLDIACLFVGKDRKVSEYMWRERQFSYLNGIERLSKMCWVKVKENDELCMPGLLQNFGKEMVESEDNNFWNRSRLWNHEDAKSTLEQKMGNEKVQALVLKYKDHGVSLTNEHFKGLSNLMFLKLDKADIKGNFKKLLSNLIWLDWEGCPMKTKRLRRLNLAKLVILDLSESQVNHLWNGWKWIMKKAKSLKVLKLSGCSKLMESPDFSEGMILERLILEGCSKLAKIRSSIKNLRKLKSLNLKYCKYVGCLPDLDEMPDLEELLIDGTSINTLDLRQGSMEKLEILSACGCEKLTSLPNSIKSLKKLRVFSIRGCEKIDSLPGDIGKLELLEMLELSETSIGVLPSSIGDLKNLRVLKMSGTRLASFPDQVTSLGTLEVLDLRSCPNLEGEIPPGIEGLSYLRELRLSSTKISSLPESIAKLFNLRVLELCECPQLQGRPIPYGLDGKVVQCPAGSHRDHGEF